MLVASSLQLVKTFVFICSIEKEEKSKKTGQWIAQLNQIN